MSKVTGEMPEGEFFILPDGKVVPIEDADGMYSFLVGRSENAEKVKAMLWGIAEECLKKENLRAAHAYFDKLLSLADTPREKLRWLGKMAVIGERLRDYSSAAKAYSSALDLPQESSEAEYFLNNNLGLCLNQLGKHAEAEKHCRTAIEIAPEYHNAHKNLGVALQGLGRYADAAVCFIRATKLSPGDPRALQHLKDLIAVHKGIFEEIPDLLAQLSECQRAVYSGEGEPPVQ